MKFIHRRAVRGSAASHGRCGCSRQSALARQLRAWLYAILRNIYVSGLRRKSRAGVIKGVDDLAPEEEAVAGEQEDHVAIRSISEALDRLPDLHREVILLVALEDMSYREVAEITGVPENTVKSRMRYALERLQTALSEYEEYARALR